MYLLLLIKDSDSGFVDYVVTKDIQKTFEFINSVVSKQSDYTSKLTSYLISSGKRLIDLQHEVLFSDASLLNVNNFLEKLKCPEIEDESKPEKEIEQVKEEAKEEVKEEEEVVEPKQPKKRIKKPE